MTIRNSTRFQREARKLQRQFKRRRQKALRKSLNIPFSKSDKVTSQNHYVPVWYQKRFLQVNNHHFFYLDMYPEIGTKPNGEVYKKRECLRLGPQRCFKQEHLYTLELFGHKSDVIEKELFEKIDDKGSKSFDFLSSPNAWQQKGFHEKFNHFIIFIDAQKLRTPRGLNFVKSLCIAQGTKPNQILVLGLMQEYRQMHCAMWVESIWEVVSAKKSNIKFIINDHPVIAYNQKFPQPNNMKIDPLVSFLGTRTIYPLDLEHCLILTHRQYAMFPDKCNPLEDRINARYGDKAIFNFESIIFERELNEEEVCQINFVIKKSAYRYISSSEKDWLYPEEAVKNIVWGDVDKVLLPPKENIVLTQSIVFGHKDGSAEGYDPFGRKVSEKEIEDFNKITRQIALGDKLSEIIQKPSKGDLYSQNIALLDSINEIFGMSRGKTIEEVRKEFSNEQIVLLYKTVAELWPYITDFYDLIPKDENRFRGLFLGDINPKTISRDITNMIHFFDEIFIISPFCNPNYIQDKFNPVRNPSQYRQDTYKLIYSLLLIEPLIRKGIVKIIPDPSEFNLLLRMKLFDRAESRVGKMGFDTNNIKYFDEFEKIQFEQIFNTYPKKHLLKLMKESHPNATDEEINQFSEYIDLRKKLDVTYLGETLDESGGQLLCSRSGLNLEGTLMFCKITGAVPFTYIDYKYKEFYSVANNSSGCKRWNPLIKLFKNQDFVFDNAGHTPFGHIARSKGFFEGFRSYLKKIYAYISEGHYDKKDLKGFCERFSDVYGKYSSDWDTIYEICDKGNSNLTNSDSRWLFPPKDIFQKGKINLILGDISTSSTDYLLEVHFPGKKAYKNVPMAIYIDYSIK